MRTHENGQEQQDAIRPIIMNLLIDTEDFVLTLNQKYLDGATDENICQWLDSIQSPDLDIRDRFQPNGDQLRNLREYYEDLVKNDRDVKVGKVKEWFKLNPHLPQPSLGMVHKFMWASKDDVEKCKKRLNMYYSLRGTDDDIYGNRDPTNPAARQMQKCNNYATLPVFTKELYRVSVSVLTSPDPDQFNAQEWIRRIFYLVDLRVKHDFCLGEVMIFDLKGFSLQHFLKFSLPLARKLVLSAEGSIPARIKQLHFVNCPSFIDKVVNMFKPFMKEKMVSRINVHMDSFGELYKSVPRELLPSEYGGSLGPMSEFSERWVKELEDNREWFINEEKNVKRIYQEARKNGKIFMDSGELFGMEGSFKKLDID